MFRLALLVFTIAAASLMGIAIIVVLSMGLDTTKPVVAAAAIGFTMAIPVTWLVARKISDLQ